MNNIQQDLVENTLAQDIARNYEPVSDMLSDRTDRIYQDAWLLVRQHRGNWEFVESYNNGHADVNTVWRKDDSILTFEWVGGLREAIEVWNVTS